MNREDHLLFEWIACVDPGFKAAKDGIDAGVTVVQEDERRTGACVFVWSGAVGDDPLFFIQFQISGV